MFFVLKFELILIIGSNNVLTEGARKVYRGRRVGQGCYRISENACTMNEEKVVLLKETHYAISFLKCPDDGD
jgi:hypothetical protein